MTSNMTNTSRATVIVDDFIVEQEEMMMAG
jgi:hypothetical protein